MPRLMLGLLSQLPLKYFINYWFMYWTWMLFQESVSLLKYLKKLLFKAKTFHDTNVYYYSFFSLPSTDSIGNLKKQPQNDLAMKNLSLGSPESSYLQARFWSKTFFQVHFGHIIQGHYFCDCFFNSLILKSFSQGFQFFTSTSS